MSAKAIFGGLFQGVGEGMISQAETRRQEALERAKRLQVLEDRQNEREWQTERDRVKAERSESQAKQFVIGEDGQYIGLTPTGDTLETGVSATAKERFGTKAGEVGGVSTGDFNAMERIANRYWGKMNSEGQFVVPEDARDNYAATIKRAEQLVSIGGLGRGEAVELAAMSISGKMDQTEARRIAEAEAREQFSGWGSGDKRNEYIKTRVPELIEASSAAEKHYQELTGQSTGSGRGLMRTANKTAEKAAAQQLPRGPDGRVSAAQLQEGALYNTSKGVVRYLGNGEFEAAE